MSGYAHLVLETLHFVSLSDSFLTNILSKLQNILAFFPISFLQTDLKSIKVDKKKFCTGHSANRALINFDHPFKWSTKEQRCGYFSRQSNFSRVNSKQVVTKQQLTCTGTLITWQSKSEQHKGKRTRDYKEKGSFLGPSESKMENRLKDTAESGLMIWRREQLRKGAHEHFITMLYTLNGCFYFNASCHFTQHWQKYLGEWRRTVVLPNSRLERWQFSALGPCSTHVEGDLGQWGKRWMYRSSEELLGQMAAKLGSPAAEA